MRVLVHGCFSESEPKMAVDRVLVTRYRDLAADHVAQMPQIIEHFTCVTVSCTSAST